MILNDFFTPQFLRFLVAGGIAACFNFATGFMLEPYLSHNLDVVAGHLCGMVVAFFLFEQKVFGRADGSRLREVVIFCIVNGLAILQTIIVFILLKDYLFPAVDWLYYPDELARMIAIAVPVFTSFLGHKYFTFRHA